MREAAAHQARNWNFLALQAQGKGFNWPYLYLSEQPINLDPWGGLFTLPILTRQRYLGGPIKGMPWLEEDQINGVVLAHFPVLTFTQGLVIPTISDPALAIQYVGYWVTDRPVSLTSPPGTGLTLAKGVLDTPVNLAQGDIASFGLVLNVKDRLWP